MWKTRTEAENRTPGFAHLAAKNPLGYMDETVVQNKVNINIVKQTIERPCNVENVSPQRVESRSK